MRTIEVDGGDGGGVDRQLAPAPRERCPGIPRYYSPSSSFPFLSLSLLAPSFLLLSHSHPLRSAVRYTDIFSLLSRHLLLTANINGSRVRYIGTHCIPVSTNVDRKQIIQRIRLTFVIFLQHCSNFLFHCISTLIRHLGHDRSFVFFFFFKVEIHVVRMIFN